MNNIKVNNITNRCFKYFGIIHRCLKLFFIYCACKIKSYDYTDDDYDNNNANDKVRMIDENNGYAIDIIDTDIIMICKDDL